MGDGLLLRWNYCKQSAVSSRQEAVLLRNGCAWVMVCCFDETTVGSRQKAVGSKGGCFVLVVHWRWFVASSELIVGHRQKAVDYLKKTINLKTPIKKTYRSVCFFSTT